MPLGGTLKRLFDATATIILLLALLPEMFCIAAAVKLTSPGPVFYRHRRVGFDGQVFVCLKFRSMVVDADTTLPDHLAASPSAREEWNLTQKLRLDPRLTSIGGFLRRWSLDELPQLFNVLAGQMSLVGPRPVTPQELDRYGASRGSYLLARPGITGLWQVSGRSNVSYKERVRLDAAYVSNWSPSLDTWVLLKTITVVVKAEGAR